MTIEAPRPLPFKHHRSLRAFMPFWRYLEEISNLASLSMQGIQLIAFVAPSLARSKTMGKSEAKNIEARAKAEVRNGFPVLINHTIVAVWSALEQAVPTICTNYLIEFPELLDRKEFESINIPSRYLLREDRDELLEEIIAIIYKGSALKPGVGRFDGLLAALGLSVKIEPDLRNKLFELSQVRNAIVHSTGNADKKLVDQCRHLKFNVGEKLKFTEAQYHDYHFAVSKYATALLEAILPRIEKSDEERAAKKKQKKGIVMKSRSVRNSG